MYRERIKVFLLLLFTSIIIYYYYDTNIYLIVNDHDVNISSWETMTLSLSARKANDSFMTLNRKRNYKHENSEKEDEMYIDNLTNIWSLDKDMRQYKNRNVISKVNDKTQFPQPFSKFLVQRIAYNKNANMSKNLPKNKQKKMKVLRHLLMKNVSNKNKDNGDSKRTNKKKIYCVSIQDEDKSSIIELIAFNASHTTKAYRL